MNTGKECRKESRNQGVQDGVIAYCGTSGDPAFMAVVILNHYIITATHTNSKRNVCRTWSRLPLHSVRWLALFRGVFGRVLVFCNQLLKGSLLFSGDQNRKQLLQWQSLFYYCHDD